MIDKDLFTANSNDNKDAVKHEKDMIARQLKLIQARRVELMHQKKMTSQQWDMLNEYVNPVPIQQLATGVNNKYIDHSNLHLELSSDSQEEDEEEEYSLEETEGLMFKKENAIKQEITF